MQITKHPDLITWLAAYGQPIQIGLIVKTTDECQWADFENGTFMITSLSFDKEGLNIGINDDGRIDDFSTAYDGFRIAELHPA